MDKKLLILLLALGLTGCLNDLPYTPKDTAPQLVMNSLISVGEDSSEVWLGLSKPGCVDTLTGGVSVHCHINGHTVIRVAPGGGEFYIYQLDDTNNLYKVKSIEGPIKCE